MSNLEKPIDYSVGFQDGYMRGRADGITRVLDILEHLDTQVLEIVKDALYKQDYQERLKGQNYGINSTD